jgi:hypothetical protein
MSDKYDQRQYLFGEAGKDMRGNLFSKAFYESDFTSKFNDATNWPSDDILAWDLYKAQYFENKPAAMRDDDVHYELTDFFMKTALWHNKLDKATSTSDRMSNISKVLDGYTKILAGRNVNDDDFMRRIPGVAALVDMRYTSHTGAGHPDTTAEWANMMQVRHGGLVDGQAGGVGSHERFDMGGTDWNGVLVAGAPAPNTAQGQRILDSRAAGGMTRAMYVPDGANLSQLQAIIGGLFGATSIPSIGTLQNANANTNGIGQYLHNGTDSEAIYTEAMGIDVVAGADIIGAGPIESRLDAWLGATPYNTDLNARGGIISAILDSAGIVTKNVLVNKTVMQNGIDLGGIQTVIAGIGHFNAGGVSQNMDQVTRSLRQILHDLETQSGLGVDTLVRNIGDKLKVALKDFVKQKVKALIDIVKRAAPGGALGGVQGSHVNDYASSVFQSYVTGNAVGGAIAIAAHPEWIDGVNTQFKDLVFNTIKAEVRVHFTAKYTTLEDADAWKFYEGVYKVWDKLNEKTKRFYEAFIELREFTNDPNSVDKWSAVTDYNRVSTGLKSNFRLNLKKWGASSTITKFEKALPLLPVSKFGSVWYTDYAGQQQHFNVSGWVASPAVNDTFRSIYNKLYNLVPVAGTDRATIVLNAGTNMYTCPTYKCAVDKYTAQYFRYKIDELIRKRFFVVSKAETAGIPAQQSTESYADIITENLWTRNKDGLLSKIVNGKEVIYEGRDSEGTLADFRKENKCFTTLVPKEGQQCTDYVFKCLIGEDGDMSGCLEYLKTEDFYKVAKAEIDNVHPYVAYRTLKRFGFRMVTNEITGLDEVEGTDTYIKFLLQSKFASEEVREIIKGDKSKIISYLELLSQYVNKNPKILNKNYTGPDEVPVPTEIKRTELAKRLGIPARVDINNFGYDLDMLGNYMKSSYFGSTYGLPMDIQSLVAPLGGQAPILLPVQTGGNFTYDFNNKKSIHNMGSRLLGTMFHGQLKTLQNKGRDLPKEEQDKINKKLKNMAKEEESIFKIVRTMEEFNSMSEYFSDYPSKILTVDNMDKLRNKHTRMVKHHYRGEVSLLSIMKALQQLIDQKSIDSSEEAVSEFKPLAMFN